MTQTAHMRRSKRTAEETADQVDIEARLAPYVTVDVAEEPNPAPPRVAWAHAVPEGPSVAEDDLIADAAGAAEAAAPLAPFDALDEIPSSWSAVGDAASTALDDGASEAVLISDAPDAIESVDAAHDSSTSDHLPSVARDDPPASPPLRAPTPVQRSLFASVDHEPQARPPSKDREAPRAVPDWERWHTPDTAHAPWAQDAAFGSALGGPAPVHPDEPHDDPDADRD